MEEYTNQVQIGEKLLEIKDLSIVYKTDLEDSPGGKRNQLFPAGRRNSGTGRGNRCGKRPPQPGRQLWDYELLPERTARITSGQILFEDRDIWRAGQS